MECFGETAYWGSASAVDGVRQRDSVEKEQDGFLRRRFGVVRRAGWLLCSASSEGRRGVRRFVLE